MRAGDGLCQCITLSSGRCGVGSVYDLGCLEDTY